MIENYSLQIKKNLDAVHKKIAIAAEKSGRGFDDVKTVVVSKFQPAEVIRAAWDAGVRIFGENYPEQAEPKIIELHDLGELEWHMIGHLQSRKAGIVARYFTAFHSLDRTAAGEKINQLLIDNNKKLDIFLEFNVGGESSKNGWDASDEKAWDRLIPDITFINGLSNLKLIGLMTMPPIMENPEDTRLFFIKLRQLKDYINHYLPSIALHDLSMGTSLDYSVAIEEGATYVRIGQAILGNRPSRN